MLSEVSETNFVTKIFPIFSHLKMSLESLWSDFCMSTSTPGHCFSMLVLLLLKIEGKHGFT